MALIIKSNIRKTVKDLDKEESISSVAEEVETALERKVEEILIDEDIDISEIDGITYEDFSGEMILFNYYNDAMVMIEVY